MSYSKILIKIVDIQTGRLHAMVERNVIQKSTSGHWNKKEILGHLIDSASNNHQRFVRAMQTDELHFPPYTQSEWVQCQKYADEKWSDLIDLWTSMNRHLAHVIAQIPNSKLQMICFIGEKKFSLETIMHDYITHLEHHLTQINPSYQLQGPDKYQPHA